MAEPVKYVYGAEADILALTDQSELWFERGFYYPTDENIPHFYQVINGAMTKKGGVSNTSVLSTGVSLNDQIISGFKNYILPGEILNVPRYFEYNGFGFTVDGIVNVEGTINIG